MLPSIGRGEAFQPQKLSWEKDKSSAEIRAGLLAGSWFAPQSNGAVVPGVLDRQRRPGLPKHASALRIIKEAFLALGLGTRQSEQ